MFVRSRAFFIPIFGLLLLTLLPQTVHSLESLSQGEVAALRACIQSALSKAELPGAVVLIGNRQRILYCSAHGLRAIEPKKLPMTVETLFDAASLTKVVATATALMQLLEAGKVGLDDSAAKHWPEFGENGKGEITIRHLLTHYSGLRSGLDPRPDWAGYGEALRRMIEERPISPPGREFIYSDLNFQILGAIIERISGEPLDRYCDSHIFQPLGMKDTLFNPPVQYRHRIAPTCWDDREQRILLGTVHDRIARKMGGVSGHAGLFTTAADLSIYAQMMLGGGSFRGVKILSPSTVEKMTAPQSPPGRIPLRGLGWEIDGPLASNRDELFPVGSYGHTGFTGTAIWIDPLSDLYVIILTSRLHPKGRGNVHPLRSEVLGLLSKIVGPISSEQVCTKRPSLVNPCREGLQKKVKTGLEVLVATGFSPLFGLRVGLITNHSGVDSGGRRSIDLIQRARGTRLIKIFSPEHGLSGNLDGRVPNMRDQVTGLPVISLYGSVLKPSQPMLDGLDALVFDIQDAGARFFTYLTTMGFAMEAAAKKGIPFYVLDRPNPLTGSKVQGPILEKELTSFTGYFPLPIRYGMTVGELAQMFNAEKRINARLFVIKMEEYRRSLWYDETGLPWVKLSPNLRSLTQTILYPGVAMVEGANVSVGRGTQTPFELLGAPWVGAEELADYLNRREIPGVRFKPVHFVPQSDRFKGIPCQGVQIILIDREQLDSPLLGVEIASALYRLYPKEFEVEKTLPLMGSRWLMDALKEMDPRLIAQRWEEPLEAFRQLRARYLIY